MALASLNDLVGAFLAPYNLYRVTASSGESGNVSQSLFGVIGHPGNGAPPTPGMAGEVVTPALAGIMPFTNPTGGKKSYLARAIFTALGGTSSAHLHDRLWHNSGIAVTTLTAQTVDSVTWPARDEDGTTNGKGVMIALEVNGATSNGAAINTITVSYTNSDGVSGRTAVIDGLTHSFPASAAFGTWVPFRLQTGDVGVRSIQSITLGTSLGSGTVNLVAYRPLCFEVMNSAYATRPMNFRDTGLPRLYDDTSIFAVLSPESSAAITHFWCNYSIAQA